MRVLAAPSTEFGVEKRKFKLSVFTSCSWLWSMRNWNHSELSGLLGLGANGQTDFQTQNSGFFLCSERLCKCAFLTEDFLLFLSCSQWFFILCSVYYIILKIKETSFKPMSFISVNCFCFCLTKQLSDLPKPLKHSSAMCCHCLEFRLFGNIHSSLNNKVLQTILHLSCCCVCVWTRWSFFLSYLCAVVKMSLCQC